MLSLLATLSTAQAEDNDGVALDDDELLDLEAHSEKKKSSSGGGLDVDTDEDDDFIDSLDSDPPPSKDPPARRPAVDDDELDAGDLLQD